MTPEPFLVPVRTAIPQSQYRHLEGIAKSAGTTVGELIRELVRRQLGSVPPIPPRQPRSNTPGKRTYARLRDTDDETIRTLHAYGWADQAIAKHLDCHRTTILGARKRLGLAANHAPVGAKKELR